MDPVVCRADPSQSYALYLPESYTPRQRWPVVFVFDPAARGAFALRRAQEAAEKHGYILAGSNNSRNGPMEASLAAADAMMRDVSSRFAIDRARVYTAGFSGGARVAVAAALSCEDCVAGVVGQGAGFPFMQGFPQSIDFAYFAAVGDTDFNFPEVMELLWRLEKMQVSARLRVYQGGHAWAPPSVWDEALAWLTLRAMQEDRMPPEPAFIADELQRQMARARAHESSGQPYLAYLTYRDIVADFADLADTSAASQRLASLAVAREVRQARQRIERQIRRQAQIAEPALQALARMQHADPRERMAAAGQVEEEIQRLRRRLERADEAEERLVLQRALNQALATKAAMQAERMPNR